MLTPQNQEADFQNIKEIPAMLQEILRTKKLSQNILESPHYSQEARELIKTFWGKASSLIWQYIKGNSKYLLPFSVLKVSPHHIPTYTKKTHKEFFRASANGDENGLVGVLESHKTTNLFDEIQEIIVQGESRIIKAYATFFDGNEHYTGVDAIIVSPNIHTSKFTLGSIVKHPDFEGMYLINIDEGRGQCLVDSAGNIVKILWFQEYIQAIQEHIPNIIKMKLDTDAVWFIHGKTTQTEFAILSARNLNDLTNISWYDFESQLEGNIVFLQQREFRNESQEKYPLKILDEWYYHNTFWDQSVFHQGYRVVKYEDAKEVCKTLAPNEKIIIKVYEKNYRKVKDDTQHYGALKDPHVAGILINPWQSQGLWSLEHDTYRLLNNDLPIKVAYL